jgi:MerR family transcriptional regulator/heat shock protein HspR
MGVNLAGIDIILQLKEQIHELQKEIEELKANEGMVPKSRSVVVKKNNYQIVLVED